eukprot:622652-Amphidinium_carterae.1
MPACYEADDPPAVQNISRGPDMWVNEVHEEVFVPYEDLDTNLSRKPTWLPNIQILSNLFVLGETEANAFCVFFPFAWVWKVPFTFN